MIYRLLLFTLFLLSSNAFADCGNDYSKVSFNCIQKSNNDYKDIRFAIGKKAKKLESRTYFYKTEFGNLGKMIIRSAYFNGKECNIYFDYTTYVGRELQASSASLTISKTFNQWTFDREGLEYKSGDDFSLSVIKGQCVFSTNRAKAAFYKTLTKPDLFNGNDLVIYTAFFLVGLAVFLVARQVFAEEDKFKASETLDEADDDKEEQPNDIILKYSRPFFKRYVTPVVNGMKNKKKLKDRYKRKLASSGMTRFLTPEDFLAFKLFLIIGFPILFLLLREFLEEQWPLSILPIISIIGYKYPDIWVNGKIDKRREEHIQNMPFIVDMLALSVEAGLDFMAAIQKVIEKAPSSSLTDEFVILIKETKIGASRAEGLRQLSWRCDTLPISSFCATLIAADSVGANIAPILKTLAGELRQKRSADAEKKGATAATKILFPMMLFILPAVFIIIGGPIGLQIMNGG